MNYSKTRLATLASVGSLLAVGQVAFAKDITIADPLAGTTFGSPAKAYPVGSVREDNETEPNTVQGQVWDLENVTYNDATGIMNVIGGYNFKLGQDTFMPGDIFLNTSGSVPTAPAPLGGNYQTYANNGWDYVIHFTSYDAGYGANAGSLEYKVINLQGGANGVGTLVDVYYDQNQKASPWRYLAGTGGTLVDIPSGVGTQDTDGNNVGTATMASVSTATIAGSPSTYGFIGGDELPVGYGGNDTHHVLTLDLGWFGVEGLTGFNGQLTMGCGNDVISAQFGTGGSELPDGGATLMLLGLGMTGMFAGYRRMRA